MPQLITSVRILLDLAVMSLAYWLAFLFRFEFQLPWHVLEVLLQNWPGVILSQYAGIPGLGVPRM